MWSIPNVMKIRYYATVLTLLTIFVGCSLGPDTNQEGKWTVASSEDGRTTVKYSITDIVDNDGKKNFLIRDFAETTFQANYKDCIALMKDVSRHKEFTGDASSEVLKKISNREWLVYYYTDNPWPIADSDLVARMVFTEDKARHSASFRITAAPGELESKGVNRMKHYQLTYTCADLGDGTIGVSFSGESNPPVQVPKWLVESAFPDAQFDSMQKLTKLIKAM